MIDKYVHIKNETLNYKLLQFININNNISAILESPTGEIKIEDYKNIKIFNPI